MANPLHDPILANDECARNAVLTSGLHVGRVRGAVFIDGESVGDRFCPRCALTLLLTKKCFDHIELFPRHAHKSHRVSVLLLQFADVRHAGAARSTPSGPKLHNRHRTHLKAFQRIARHPGGNRQWRRCVTDPQRFRGRFRFNSVFSRSRRHQRGGRYRGRCRDGLHHLVSVPWLPRRSCPRLHFNRSALFSRLLHGLRGRAQVTVAPNAH